MYFSLFIAFMNVGLFFGSFNPVHCGHLMIANYCLAYTDLQEVWMVISPQNPFKNPHTLMPQNKRLQWLQDALKDCPLPIKLCDIELNLPVPSYTITTLEALSTQYPQHKFTIVMGADNLTRIEFWKDWQRIVSQYEMMVYPRLGVDSQELSEKYKAHFVDAPIINISSTMLRQALAEGRNLSAFVPRGVHFFDKKNNDNTS
ncbi:putative nicotinate-nucleotide adenylyltransferase [Bacteroidia bacterium]|nr:putative nicotinate-nucleotide adenylyltransferase [Bacteroidia bacterium]